MNAQTRGRRIMFHATYGTWLAELDHVRYLVYNMSTERGYVELLTPVRLASLHLPEGGHGRFLDMPRHCARDGVIGFDERDVIIEQGLWQPRGQGNRSDMQAVGLVE